MVGIHTVSGRHSLQQRHFHRQGRFARGQARPVADPKDVRVNRHRGLAKGAVEHHIGRFAPHAGQRLQRFACARHLAVVLCDQDFAGLQQVAGLAVVEADGLDVRLDAVQPQVQHGLWVAGGGKQPARGLVHAHVGGLSRQQHRHQQFEHRCVDQLGDWLRVGLGQGGKEGCNMLFFHDPTVSRILMHGAVTMRDFGATRRFIV